MTPRRKVQAQFTSSQLRKATMFANAAIAAQVLGGCSQSGSELSFPQTSSVSNNTAGNNSPARFSEAALTNPQGFAGADGAVRLTANGLSERSLAILEIETYRSVVIDPAPQTAAPQAIAAAPALKNQ